jgi:hypothetical protein
MYQSPDGGVPVGRAVGVSYTGVDVYVGVGVGVRVGVAVGVFVAVGAALFTVMRAMPHDGFVKQAAMSVPVLSPMVPVMLNVAVPSAG